MKVTKNRSFREAISQVRVGNVKEKKEIPGIVVIKRPKRFIYLPYIVFPWSFIYLEETKNTIFYLSTVFHIYIFILFIDLGRKETKLHKKCENYGILTKCYVAKNSEVVSVVALSG